MTQGRQKSLDLNGTACDGLRYHYQLTLMDKSKFIHCRGVSNMIVHEFPIGSDTEKLSPIKILKTNEL